jgi:hypothetical protein
MKVWKGREEEGDCKGLMTLFVASLTVTPRQLHSLLEKNIDVEQIYFGAGECSNINWDLVMWATQNWKRKKITCELLLRNVRNIPALLPEFVNIIVTVNVEDLQLLHKVKYKKINLKLQNIKTDNKILLMSKLSNFIETDMTRYSKLVYKDDEVLL